jgi:hypothetical protein
MGVASVAGQISDAGEWALLGRQPDYIPESEEEWLDKVPGLLEYTQRLQLLRTETDLLGHSFGEYLPERLQLTRTALHEMLEQGVQPSHEEVQRLVRTIKSIELAQSISRTITEGVGGGIQEAISGVIQGTQRLEDAFARMGENIALGLSKSVLDRGINAIQGYLEKLIMWLAQTGLNAYLGTSPGGGGGTYNTTFGEARATGGYFEGSFTPLRRFGSGGISDGPTLGLIGEGKYRREAVVPLPDGRHIPAIVQGGAGDVIINVENKTGLPVDMKKLSQRQDDQGRQIITVVLQALTTDPGFRAAIASAGR